MKRVILTGASGFVGKAATRFLAENGFEVHAFSRTRPSSVPSSNYHWHPIDLHRTSEMEAEVKSLGAEYLLHLAWYAEPGAFWTSPENLVWVGTTLNLVKFFVEAGGQRAVLAGSCAEYDWSYEVYHEAETPLAPATLYGVSKDATRRVVERYASQVGLSFAWGRLFFLYGPEEDPRRLVSSVVRGLLDGKRTPTTAGTQRRDFMHVSEVARALGSLLISNVRGAVNIASGREVSIRDVVTQLADLVGRPELLELGSLPTRAGDPESLLADIARLRDEVGFVEEKSLEDGLRETVDWWQSQPTAQG